MWRRCLRRRRCGAHVPTVAQVATRTDTVDRNMALRTRLPAAVGAHVFTYLSARDHGAAAESCRYLLAVALQPAASPVCVELPQPGNVAAFTMPSRWRPRELAIYNTYVDEMGVRYLGVSQLHTLLFDNPRLHSLRLAHVYFAANWSSAPFTGTLPGLRRLSLFGPADQLYARLLACAAATLEDLRIESVPGAGYMLRGERPLSEGQFLAALQCLKRLDTLVLRQTHFRQAKPAVSGGGNATDGTEWMSERLARLELSEVRPLTLATTLVRVHRDTLRQLYVTVVAADDTAAYARAVAACSRLEVLHAPTIVAPIAATAVACVASLTHIATHELDATSGPELARFLRLTHVACTYSGEYRASQIEAGGGSGSAACCQVRVLELHVKRHRASNRESERAYIDLLVSLFPATQHLVLRGTCLMVLEQQLCQRLSCLRRVTSRLADTDVRMNARMRARLASDCPHVHFDERNRHASDARAARWEESLHRHFTV